MATINRITHPNKLTEQKVNFFADYFQFAVDTMGLNDQLAIENPLSLVDKIIFQLQFNKPNCIQYLDVYFLHPLFNENNKHLKIFSNSEKVISEIQNFLKAGKQKRNIVNNCNTLNVFTEFQRELKQKMFKKALRTIISYLKCIHSIDHHQEDLIFCTNILVSEFILNNRSKQDLNMVFTRILEYRAYSIDNNLKKQKENHFDEQFQGIYRQLKQTKKSNYFIFRVLGLITPTGFSFKYNKVTFFHPKNTNAISMLYRNDKHSLLKKLVEDTSSNAILAVVKIEYFSLDLGVKNAVQLIQDELKFLNAVCKSNASLEIFAYLATDLKNYTLHRSAYEHVYPVTDSNVRNLLDNPFRFLKNIDKKYKNHFLRFELQYVEAMSTESIKEYWKYLENLLPKNEEQKNEIIDTASSILLINSEQNYKDFIRRYLIDAITPFFICDHDTLGLSQQKHLYYYRQLKSDPSFDFSILRNDLTHPFLTYLIDLHEKTFTSKEYNQLKNFYSFVLWEAKAQRNSILHADIKHEKSIIFLKNTIPRLITKFRWILFHGMESKQEKDFNDLIKRLKIEGQLKLN
ncbi:MAG TPA: hypothetical protein VD908_00830 [Cytophagales bacterium]|nr:hypothetical protein [Cytophagales bacterium]